MPDPEALLTIKELAAAVKRHRSYISAMKRDGFPMPGGLASVREFREFLARNPFPRRRRPKARECGPA
jgi:hypothetical protein